MRKLKIIALGLGIFASACKKEGTVSRESSTESEIVARIGDDVITVAEFMKAMQHRRVGNDEKSRRALLHELIGKRKMVIKAKTEGLDNDPEVVQQINNILVAKLRANLMEQQSLDSLPTEEEIQTYYNTHSDDFKIPSRIRVAMIFVEAPQNFSENKRKMKREKIKTALMEASEIERNANHFGALAVRFSEDQATRYRGGDLGYFVDSMADSQHGPEIIASAFALQEPGDLSEIIETQKGFYLLKLLDRSAETLRSFNTAAPQIRSKITAERREKAETALFEKATLGVEASINESVFDLLELGTEEVKSTRSSPPPPLPQ